MIRKIRSIIIRKLGDCGKIWTMIVLMNSLIEIAKTMRLKSFTDLINFPDSVSKMSGCEPNETGEILIEVLVQNEKGEENLESRELVSLDAFNQVFYIKSYHQINKN